MGISKKFSIFFLLILAKPSICLDSVAIFHKAISQGDHNVVSSIVEKMPELINSINSDGDTVLHMAVLSNDIGITKIVINAAKKHNPKLLYVKNRLGLTILHLAQIQMDPNPKLIEYLKETDPELGKIPLRSCF